jgi:adenylate kinase
MKLILLGAPGAGKGTQAEKISKEFNIPTLSTGAILRKNVSEGTELGVKAKEYMDKGHLVPDEIVIGMVADYLSADEQANGYILDGFPRSIPQAEALDAMGVKLDVVLSIEVEDETIIERMSGRRVCPKCGATFHTKYNPPKAEGVCDTCGAALTIRADDNEETVKDRLAIYHAQTEPLKEFYSAKGLLVTVHGCEKVEDTTALVFKALKEA